MIFVDTSIWISALRGRPQDMPVVQHLEELLDSDQVALSIPVKIEILAGARKSERSKLDRIFSALPTFHSPRETWDQVQEWVVSSASEGQQFGAMDLLIAAIARNENASIWTLDQDFIRMEKLGFVKIHKPTRN